MIEQERSWRTATWRGVEPEARWLQRYVAGGARSLVVRGVGRSPFLQPSWDPAWYDALMYTAVSDVISKVAQNLPKEKLKKILRINAKMAYFTLKVETFQKNWKGMKPFRSLI